MTEKRVQSEGEEGERERQLAARIKELEARIEALQAALDGLSGAGRTSRNVIPFGDDTPSPFETDPSRTPWASQHATRSLGKIVRIANRDLAFARLEANGDVIALTLELASPGDLARHGFEPELEGRQVSISRDEHSGAATGFSLQQAASNAMTNRSSES
jgi:hypothetical protein